MQRRAQIVGLYKPGPTMGQIITRDAQRNREAAKSLRQASYASARLVAAPRGVPLYAVGRGQMSRGEVKFFDCEPVNTVVSNPYGLQLVTATTGGEPSAAFTGITELNCVQQGATSYNRIGTKILIKSIDLRFNAFMAGSGPVVDSFRYLVVYDHSPNGAFPAYSDILSDNISGTAGFHSRINMSNRSRFIILRDRTIPMTYTNDAIVSCKEFIKCKLETQFKSTTGAIGDITSGAIYLFAFASLSTSVCWIQTSSVISRIRFFD